MALLELEQPVEAWAGSTDLPFCRGSTTAVSVAAHDPSDRTPSIASRISRWCSSSGSPFRSAKATASPPSDRSSPGTSMNLGRTGTATVTTPPTCAAPTAPPQPRRLPAHTSPLLHPAQDEPTTNACPQRAPNPTRRTPESASHTGRNPQGRPRPKEPTAHARADAQPRNPEQPSNHTATARNPSRSARTRQNTQNN